MPRTVDEILQHADELAARFGSYEPNSADELDILLPCFEQRWRNVPIQALAAFGRAFSSLGVVAR